MESRWNSSGKYSQESQRWTLGILEEVQKYMTELQFKGRIIFMSMYVDIAWSERGSTEKCEKKSVTVANYARTDQRRNGAELIRVNQMEFGTRLLNK